MDNEDSNGENICGQVFTGHDEFSFFHAETYPNAEGNICIKLNNESHITLSPIMAKRLRNSIDEAIRESIAMILSEE